MALTPRWLAWHVNELLPRTTGFLVNFPMHRLVVPIAAATHFASGALFVVGILNPTKGTNGPTALGQRSLFTRRLLDLHLDRCQLFHGTHGEWIRRIAAASLKRLDRLLVRHFTSQHAVFFFQQIAQLLASKTGALIAAVVSMQLSSTIDPQLLRMNGLLQFPRVFQEFRFGTAQAQCRSMLRMGWLQREDRIRHVPRNSQIGNFFNAVLLFIVKDALLKIIGC